MLSCDLAMAILRMRLPGCQDRLATFACHDRAFNECLLMCPADVGQDFAGQMNDRQDVGHVMANAGGPYGWAFIGGGVEKRCVIGDWSKQRTRKVCRQRMEGYRF